MDQNGTIGFRTGLEAMLTRSHLRASEPPEILKIGGIGIVVVSNLADACEGLARWVPGAEVVKGQGCDWFDPKMWRLSIWLVSNAHEAESAFVDGGVPGVVEKRHPALFVDDGDQTWYWLDEAGVVVRVKLPTKSVDLFADSENAALYWGRKVARQLWLISMRASGSTCIAHSAAAELEGNGVLILGPAGAGKTTAMLALVRDLGWNFVSNDRVVIIKDDRGVAAHNWPSVVDVGPGTLASRYLDPGLSAVKSRCARSGKRRFEVADILQKSRIRSSCQPSIILLAGIDLDHEESSWHEISIMDAERTLRVTSMYMLDEPSFEWLPHYGMEKRSVQNPILHDILNSITAVRAIQIGRGHESLMEALQSAVNGS